MGSEHKDNGSCLAHHTVDACDSSIQRRNSARPDREVHADPTEWTDARIRRMVWMGK